MTKRREFFATLFKTGGALCLGALPLGVLSSKAKASDQHVLRPPGAIREEDFLSACNRCGLCVRACPYDTLKLSENTTPTWGTPYFVPRDVACEMCEKIYCVEACPTGALDHSLVDIDEAKMGVAVLTDQENCLAFLGLRCEVCYRVCPVIDKAITLDRVINQRTGKHAEFIPVVHAEYCTGCGKCEEACVLPVGKAAAIQVLPKSVARSSLAEHYRIGWEEKRKNQGESYMKDMIEMDIRQPITEEDLREESSSAPKKANRSFKEFKP